MKVSFQDVVEAIFDSEKERNLPWLKYPWFIGLYVVGSFFWDKFTSWKTITLDFIDWGYLITPRLTFLQNAYLAGKWPLHMAGTAPLLGLTDRYFVIPDVISTPQTILLLLVNVPTFVMIDIMIHYSLGLWGLLCIRRKFKLSLFASTVLFFLFTFNGHILAHYTVGHLNWEAYFLFPFIFYYLFCFLDGNVGWRWVAGFSLVMFYILLVGGEHHFLWILIFLGVLLFFSKGKTQWLIAAVLFSCLLGAVRLLPPAFDYKIFTEIQTFKMALGYPSLAEVFESMVFLRRPNAVNSEYLQFNIHGYSEFYPEFNLYLGILGTIFILVFGIYFWFRQHRPQYRELIVPAFVLLALAIGSTYWLLRLTGIPIFSGERVSSRMIILPSVLYMIMSVYHFQAWINEKKLSLWQQTIAMCALGLMIIDLYNNLRVWRFQETAKYFYRIPLDMPSSALANHSDSTYTASLLIGLLITSISAGLLVFMSVREKRVELSK